MIFLLHIHQLGFVLRVDGSDLCFHCRAAIFVCLLQALLCILEQIGVIIVQAGAVKFKEARQSLLQMRQRLAQFLRRRFSGAVQKRSKSLRAEGSFIVPKSRRGWYLSEVVVRIENPQSFDIRPIDWISVLQIHPHRQYQLALFIGNQTHLEVETHVMMKARTFLLGGDEKNFCVWQRKSFFNLRKKTWLYGSHIIEEELPVCALPAQFFDDGFAQCVSVM